MARAGRCASKGEPRGVGDFPCVRGFARDHELQTRSLIVLGLAIQLLMTLGHESANHHQRRHFLAVPDDCQRASGRRRRAKPPRLRPRVVRILMGRCTTPAGWTAGGAGLNIAHEAVDRHTAQLHGNRVAIRWIARSGERRDFTYDALRGLTSRFANVVTQIGIRKGNVVATLAGWAFTSCTRSARIWRCVARREPSRNLLGTRTWPRRSATFT